MNIARFITTLVLCLITHSVVRAQDRGVSIPDVFTPNPADAFVAQEVTDALRIAGGMTSGWRPSTADVPLAELMRACGASLETDPDLACMTRMVVTRDASMEGGLVLFAFMERVGVDNGFRLVLVLYDMRAGEIAERTDADVDRIMAPAARNRMAAEWIRDLTTGDHASSDTPHAPSDTPSEVPLVSSETPRGASGEERVDTSLPDTIGWILIGTAAASAIGAAITGGMLLGLNGDERYNAYRGTWDATRVSNVCDVAASDPSAEGRYALGVCNDAQTYEALSIALWTAAGTLGITGTVFLLAHPFATESEGPAVTLVPTFGLNRAGLDVTVEF